MTEQVRLSEEEIARTPIESHKYKGKRYLTLDSISQILALIPDKPTEPPPGLRDEEICELCPMDCKGATNGCGYLLINKSVAQAQRDADIKYYRGEV